MRAIVASLMLGMTAILLAGCCCHKGKAAGGCPPGFAPGGCPPVVQPGLYGASAPVPGAPTGAVVLQSPVVHAAPPAHTTSVPLNSLPTY